MNLKAEQAGSTLETQRTGHRESLEKVSSRMADRLTSDTSPAAEETPTRLNILVVDDENNILQTTAATIESIGHQAFTAHNTRQARRNLQEHSIHAIFLDIRLGTESGLALLRTLREEGLILPVIMFTGFSSVESAIEAIKSEATDYIQKPFVPNEIRRMLERIQLNIRSDPPEKKKNPLKTRQSSTILFDSEEEAVRKTMETAEKAAQSHANLLILGPSGTGKTVLSRHLHSISPRSQEAFVTVNCPSLSRDLLESELFGHVKGAFTGAVTDTWGKVSAAEKGTLFLDEIGELPQAIQPKLLRLLQEQEYERVGETKTHTCNIRVIAATNRDLETEVKEGRFREDLYYRLKVIELSLPPLAERVGDILPLAENYLANFSQKSNRKNAYFNKEARNALLEYSWPGNLREMRNVVERAVILSDGEEIGSENLPAEFGNQQESAIRPGHTVSLARIEEEHIRRILTKTHSLEQAARILDIDTATLYRKRKRMGLA